MSYNRDAANKYDSKRRSNFVMNRGTKPVFGQVGRKVDAESEKPKLPSNNFVDRPKGPETEQGESSKPLRNELNDVEKDEEKQVDKNDFVSKPSPATTRKAPVVTHDDLIEKHSIGGAFSKAWTIVDHINIPPTLQPKKSWFLPNFIIGSVILEALETCLDGNEELKWIAPNYFSLPVRVYYCVMFYIQIMKAKDAAGRLGKNEGSWFRSFKRNFPLESLPIVGPLVPFFSNITAVKPNDDKYDYIYPDYKTSLGLTVDKGNANVDPAYFIQPNVLIIADFLRQFTTLSLQALEGQTNNQYDYFDDTGSLIPHRIGQQFTFAGIEFPPVLTVATSSVLSNTIVDKPLPETLSRTREIHSYWRKSKATDIPTPTATNDYTSIGESMRMIDDFEWFESCIQWQRFNVNSLRTASI